MKTNDQILEEASQWLVDQFKVFEEIGFTHENIVGAKDFYFSKHFLETENNHGHKC